VIGGVIPSISGSILDPGNPTLPTQQFRSGDLRNPERGGFGHTTITLGYIVVCNDPAWQQQVMDEAVRMRTPVAQGEMGYSGVFPVDVGRCCGERT
jgi:hypothetical protein